MIVSRAQVLAHRVRATQLSRPTGTLDDTAVLDLGVQDTGADGAAWSLALRGLDVAALPPAAVLLAQGAGRLIRSTGDRGVVAVLDPRLETAGYSRVLLDSLPGFYRARSKEAVLASLRAIDADAAPLVPAGARPSERRRVVAAG